MITSLFEILLGVFFAALAYRLLSWAVATFKIGALSAVGWHISRREYSLFYWILLGWGALMSIVSLAAATVSFAHAVFGIDPRFWI